MVFSIINQELWGTPIFGNIHIPIPKSTWQKNPPADVPIGSHGSSNDGNLFILGTDDHVRQPVEAGIKCSHHAEVSGGKSLGFGDWMVVEEVEGMVEQKERDTIDGSENPANLFELGSTHDLRRVFEKNIHSRCEIKMFFLALKVDFYSMGVLDLKSKQQADG